MKSLQKRSRVRAARKVVLSPVFFRVVSVEVRSLRSCGPVGSCKLGRGVHFMAVAWRPSAKFGAGSCASCGPARFRPVGSGHAARAVGSGPLPLTVGSTAAAGCCVRAARNCGVALRCVPQLPVHPGSLLLRPGLSCASRLLLLRPALPGIPSLTAATQLFRGGDHHGGRGGPPKAALRLRWRSRCVPSVISLEPCASAKSDLLGRENPLGTRSKPAPPLRARSAAIIVALARRRCASVAWAIRRRPLEGLFERMRAESREGPAAIGR